MSIPYVGIYRFFIDFTLEKMNCTVRFTVTSNCNLTQTRPRPIKVRKWGSQKSFTKIACSHQFRIGR